VEPAYKAGLLTNKDGDAWVVDAEKLTIAPKSDKSFIMTSDKLLKVNTWDFEVAVVHREKAHATTFTVKIDVRLDPCESPQGPGILKANESQKPVVNYYMRTHGETKSYPVSIIYEPAHCVSSKYVMAMDYGETKTELATNEDVDKVLTFNDAAVAISASVGANLANEGTYVVDVSGRSFTHEEEIRVDKTKMQLTVNLIDPCKGVKATNKPELTENGFHYEHTYTLR